MLCIVITDIDECTVDFPPCHENATCNNLIGSFECDCNSGFSGDGINDCNGKKNMILSAVV